MDIERRIFKWPDRNGGVQSIYWQCGCNDTLPAAEDPREDPHVEYLQLVNGDEFKFPHGLRFETESGQNWNVDLTRGIENGYS